MPITKREFQLGINEEIQKLMVKIYDFLASRGNLAFSESELEELVVEEPGYRVVDKALEVLVEIGAVERRNVAGKSYFAFLHEVDKNTWELKPGF